MRSSRGGRRSIRHSPHSSTDQSTSDFCRVLRWAGELGTEPPIPLLFDAESAIETAIQAWRQKKKSAARFNRGSVVVNNALVEALVTKMLLFWDIIPCVSAA